MNRCQQAKGKWLRAKGKPLAFSLAPLAILFLDPAVFQAILLQCRHRLIVLLVSQLAMYPRRIKGLVGREKLLHQRDVGLPSQVISNPAEGFAAPCRPL